MSLLIPPEVEQKYVQDIYQCISGHFSHTRFKPWPIVDEFLNTLEPGSVCADVGCGNGKNMLHRPHLFMLGSDRCENLVTLCTEQHLEAFVADNLRMPYRTGSLDALVSIAVIHHFCTPARRLLAVQELYRVMRPHGRALIYVWSLENQTRPAPSQEAMVSWTLDTRHHAPASPLPAHVEMTPKGLKMLRYYHLFKQGELEELLIRAAEWPAMVDWETLQELRPGGCDGARREGPTTEPAQLPFRIRIVRSGADKENWFAEVVKEPPL